MFQINLLVILNSYQPLYQFTLNDDSPTKFCERILYAFYLCHLGFQPFLYPCSICHLGFQPFSICQLGFQPFSICHLGFQPFLFVNWDFNHFGIPLFLPSQRIPKNNQYIFGSIFLNHFGCIFGVTLTP